MNPTELTQRAIEEVEQALSGAPADRRIVHREAEQQWYPELLRDVSAHRLSVLERAADIVVFFDEAGREIGWRDDGRQGAAQPAWIDREVFLRIVVSELELPAETWLGKLAIEELPPCGWTCAGVVFLSRLPQPEQALRVWLDPARMRVIQCLTGPFPGEASQ